jgi:hypothetical protein
LRDCVIQSAGSWDWLLDDPAINKGGNLTDLPSRPELLEVLNSVRNLLRYHSDAQAAIFQEIAQLLEEDAGPPTNHMRLPTLDEWIKREVLELQSITMEELSEEVASIYSLDVIDNLGTFRTSQNAFVGNAPTNSLVFFSIRRLFRTGSSYLLRARRREIAGLLVESRTLM